MLKYYLEFILNIQNESGDILEESMRELGEGLEINLICEDNSVKGKDFKIHIHTDDPTIVFDACSQFGRIRSVKINETTT